MNESERSAEEARRIGIAGSGDCGNSDETPKKTGDKGEARLT